MECIRHYMRLIAYLCAFIFFFPVLYVPALIISFFQFFFTKDWKSLLRDVWDDFRWLWDDFVDEWNRE
jgi:hypothetical protein